MKHLMRYLKSYPKLQNIILRHLIKSAGHAGGYAEFIKQDNTLRKMWFITGTTLGVKGNGAKLKSKSVVRVMDIIKVSWRSIPIDRLTRLDVHGIKII